jgi:hypothetical protein
MGIGINLKDLNRRDHVLQFDRRPDVCPLCHHAMEFVDHEYAYYNTDSGLAQLVHRCQKISCQGLFFANYWRPPSTNQLFFSNASPINHVPRSFSEIIQKTSKEFCDIYNQAQASESQGNLNICGVGYRKALEFLLKDYLIGLHPGKAEEIKTKFLGKCIEEYISNANIKTVAKRAAWLGNDETHYVRIWEGKDLQDLKKLVDLTVHWIEMEQLTNDVMKEMPEK